MKEEKNSGRMISYMPFEVILEKYSGPLQLLLELIEKQKLPITEVSLAKVTESYLSYINTNKPPTEELADFLVIATRLLLIKSHELLPEDEMIEEEVKDTLASQLELYKLFSFAAELLNNRHQCSHVSFGRAQSDLIKTNTFELPDELNSDMIRCTFGLLLKRLEPFFKIRQAAIERIVSVKERIKELHDVILKHSRLTFKDLVGKSRSKIDVVVSFLALLELVKQHSARTIQLNPFEDIEVKHIN